MAAAVAMADERQQRPRRREQEERLPARRRRRSAAARPGRSNSASSAGSTSAEPREADRPLSEVAHVRRTGLRHRSPRGRRRRARAIPGTPCDAEERRRREPGSAPPAPRARARSRLMPSVRDRHEPDHHDRARTARRRGGCRTAETTNSTMRITTAIGTTYGSKSGVSTCRPSTALRAR